VREKKIVGVNSSDARNRLYKMYRLRNDIDDLLVADWPNQPGNFAPG